jgi:hypothetical protein
VIDLVTCRSLCGAFEDFLYACASA